MALHLLFVALGAAVPLYGVLAWGWAVGTAMLLLALECLVSFGPMGARILRHERLTQDANHRRPSVYGRFGQWRIAAPAGRFVVDYLTRGGVAAAAAVFVACVIPLAYARKYPAQASPMQLQWDGVALGLALALALAAAEVALQWSRWGRESFADLHRAAGVPMLLALGLVLVLMFTPLWADWIRHPLALLLPLIALRGWLEVTRGAPRP